MYSKKFFSLLPLFLSLVMVVTLFGTYPVSTVYGATVTGSDVVEFAKKFLGTPYKKDAWGPNHFDNWSFTNHVYEHFGINLKNSPLGQSRQGKLIYKKDLQKGDLVFFGYNRDRVIHVGIYIGNNRFIDAYKYSDKVAIHKLEGIYAKYYLGAKRILGYVDSENNNKDRNNQTDKADQVVRIAKKYLGVDYKLGADYNLDGSYKFDCSSFTQKVFHEVGIRIPRAAIPQYRATKDREVSKSQTRKGDLVFFDLNRNGYIDHVGIYIGDGKFIHASTANGGKVQISSMSNNRFWKVTHFKTTRVL